MSGRKRQDDLAPFGHHEQSRCSETLGVWNTLRSEERLTEGAPVILVQIHDWATTNRRRDPGSSKLALETVAIAKLEDQTTMPGAILDHREQLKHACETGEIHLSNDTTVRKLHSD